MHGGSAKFSDLYELQEDIGVGSYSICKRCVHRVSAMDYAVKVTTDKKSHLFIQIWLNRLWTSNFTTFKTASFKLFCISFCVLLYLYYFLHFRLLLKISNRVQLNLDISVGLRLQIQHFISLAQKAVLVIILLKKQSANQMAWRVAAECCNSYVGPGDINRVTSKHPHLHMQISSVHFCSHGCKI